MQKLAFVIRIDHLAEVEKIVGSEPMHAIHRQFVETVRLACRSTDVVLHCAADECGAVLWVSDADDGARLADRIQDRVRHNTFRTDDGLEVRLTCSIGFAAHPLAEGESELRDWEVRRPTPRRFDAGLHSYLIRSTDCRPGLSRES